MRDKTPPRHAAGFPSDSTPRLPAPGFAAARRFQHCSVSGFPLPCLRSCRPYAVALSVQELRGPPKFFVVSLPACHGLRTPADLHLLATTDVRVLPSGALKPSASATSLFEAVPALQGARSPLRPPGYSVYASSILFVVCPTTSPPWTQDSIRVGGSPLPDKDFHLARDAKLVLARQRCASAAAGSRSEARADAGGSRLQAVVRWRRGWDRRRVSPPYSAGGQSLDQGPPPATTPSVCPVSARRSPARTGHRHCGTWRPTAQQLRLRTTRCVPVAAAVSGSSGPACPPH